MVRISTLELLVLTAPSAFQSRALSTLLQRFIWYGRRNVELASYLIRTHALHPSHHRMVWHFLLSKCRHLRAKAYQQASANAFLPRFGVPAGVPVGSWAAKVKLSIPVACSPATDMYEEKRVAVRPMRGEAPHLIRYSQCSCRSPASRSQLVD